MLDWVEGLLRRRFWFIVLLFGKVVIFVVLDWVVLVVVDFGVLMDIFFIDFDV